MTTPEASATPPAEPVDLKNDPNIIALNQELADAKAQLGDMQRAKAEAERVAEINRMCALPRAQAVLKPGAVAKFIEEKKPVEAVRDELFEAMAADQDRTQGEFNTQVRVSGGEDSAEKWLKGAQALVIQKCSPQALATVRQDMSLRNENTSDLNLGEFRGMSMLDLAKDCLARAGVRTRGMDKREIVGRAFTMRARGEGYITQGTGDFPTLLENTMHKVLQARYRTTADTWSRFCATGSVSDFRTHNRYRTGSLGTLDLVLENGEYKYKAIPEGEKSTIAATTKGNLYNLSRQAIINDDMGVLNGIAMAAGRAARLSIEVDVYTLLALNSGLGPTMSDGLTLFHATHANVGTGGVPSVTTFDELNNLLGKMLDVTGNEVLDLRPSVWVGPKSLGMSVRVINEAQYDTTVSNKFQVPNGVRGIFSDIVDTARITGTRWYAFANPAEVPTIEVAFLDGNQEPFVDNETGWSVDGVTWKVRHDYGVAAVDYRGAVTNAGA